MPVKQLAPNGYLIIGLLYAVSALWIFVTKESLRECTCFFTDGLPGTERQNILVRDA